MLAGEGQALAVRLLLAEPADLVAAGVMDGDLAVLLYCQPPVVGEICRAHVILCTLAGGRAEVGGPIGVLGRAVFGREELQMATWALPPGGPAARGRVAPRTPRGYFQEKKRFVNFALQNWFCGTGGDADDRRGEDSLSRWFGTGRLQPTRFPFFSLKYPRGVRGAKRPRWWMPQGERMKFSRVVRNEKGPGHPGPFVVSGAQCAWLLSQSSRLGRVSNVCSGGGQGRVHSSVSAYSFQ